jgi:hypothetical protein
MWWPSMDSRSRSLAVNASVCSAERRGKDDDDRDSSKGCSSRMRERCRYLGLTWRGDGRELRQRIGVSAAGDAAGREADG